ncbi:50s ribosomal protein l36e [Stemphylium lycopersici]|nr:50s ribosomal protein l36e [Stemphylium lycopersici]RAR09888.1 50s ribosomal protein l36e [Stemphylium lycopersici]
MPGDGYGYTWENGSRQPMFIITTAVLLFLATIAVALRIGLDDKFMVGAWVITVALGIQNGFLVGWGTGANDTNSPIACARYAYQVVYPWALFLVKASILALYHRIFVQKSCRRLIYAVAGFVTVQTIVVTFVNAFECNDEPWRAWSPSFPEGCNNLALTYFAMASVNILTDLFILGMPLRAFGRLKLQSGKRFALLGIFMVGGVAVIASIIRLYALYIYAVTDDPPYDDIFASLPAYKTQSYSQSLTAKQILLLSQIEVNAAIISASAPALRPLLKKAFASSSQSRSSNYPLSRSNGDIHSSKYFSRTGRYLPHGQSELLSFAGASKRISRPVGSCTRNTSEESILGADGITKTVDVTFEEHYAKGSEMGGHGDTHGYEGARKSDVC